MLDLVRDSDTAARRLTWGTRHNDNGKNGVKFGTGWLYFFLLLGRLGSILSQLIIEILETWHTGN
jgi:hypothetical protein